MAELYQAGWSCRDIADVLGREVSLRLSRQQVYWYLVKAGVRMRHKVQGRHARKRAA
jgi:hypothetical protein